jgi:subtilisin-like proprotein convertase family protein
LAVFGVFAAGSGAAQAVAPTTVTLPRPPALESEANGTAPTADKIVSGQRIRAMILPAGDVDFFSFQAKKNARVYAATMTSWSASSTIDTTLELIGPNGTTVIETDNNNGWLGSTSSTISGAVIPATGKYYLKVSGPNTIRPYDLYLFTRLGSIPAETEPNDAAPQTLPSSGKVRGSLSVVTDVDRFSLPHGAGAISFLSLDLDPERDATSTAGRLGFGLFATQSIFAADDGAEADADSEALFSSPKASGPREVVVDSGGLATGSYALAVSTIAPVKQKCRVYPSVGAVPLADLGLSTSAINVADSFVMGRVAVDLNIDHTFMADLDIVLQTPAGNDIALATDVGPTTSAAYNWNGRLDDYAAIPLAGFPNVTGQVLQPELATRLAYLDGERANGTWTLAIRDDATADTGTLNGWSLILCAKPAPPKSTGTIFTTDFESGAAGFTHSGTQDEWELGLPAFAPITTCASGANCWKTDLDNSYNASSSQDLVSGSIALPAKKQAAVSWAHRFQIESANFDHYWVEIREADDSNPRRLFEWTGATMTAAVGNPAATLAQSAGWSTVRADVSAYAGKTVELVFHADGDTTVQHAGVAIDDVKVNTFDSKPPQTRITKKPAKSTSSTTAAFRFKSSEAGSRFQCKLDKGKFRPCKASYTKKNLKPGKHTLQVRAKDKAGNLDTTPARFSWTVLG